MGEDRGEGEEGKGEGGERLKVLSCHVEPSAGILSMLICKQRSCFSEWMHKTCSGRDPFLPQ